MTGLIRTMQEEDLDAVLPIEQACHYSPWTRQQFLNSINNDVAWILSNEMEIVGYVVFKIILDEMDLLNIVVAPPHQGQGYGRQLLMALMKEAKQLKRPAIFLEVRRSNAAAIHLYESCGFRQMGLRKNYYLAQSGTEDALIYQWTFYESV